MAALVVVTLGYLSLRRRCDALPHVSRARLSGLSCAVERCRAPWGDCDRDPANGCEARLDTPSRCGACGARCALDHATARCEDGECAVASCAEGFADCDRDPTNGCEADLGGDPSHCGGCGRACGLPHARARCDQGRCAVATCDELRGDCDGDPSNGCETDLGRDPARCGDCARACTARGPGRAGCALGRCYTACADGSLDCDGDPANGCEVARDHPAHCGGCGLRCAGGAPCLGGACVARCAPGFGDCDRDGVCETDTTAACEVGLGACVRQGHLACDPAGGVRCEGRPGDPQEERCNGEDDDCNGTVDDLAPGGVCARGPCEVGRVVCGAENGRAAEVCERTGFLADGAPCRDARTEEGGACRSGLCACPGETMNCHGRCRPLGRPCVARVGGCDRRGSWRCDPEGTDSVCDVDGGACVEAATGSDGGRDAALDGARDAVHDGSAEGGADADAGGSPGDASVGDTGPDAPRTPGGF